MMTNAKNKMWMSLSILTKNRMGIYIFAALIIAPGCTDRTKLSEQIKWRETLNKDDKKPYGTFLAYHSLSAFFPEATINDLSEKYHFSSMDGNMSYATHGCNLVIVAGISVNFTEKEWDKLREFVRTGNELVIFSDYYIDKKISEELGCYLDSKESVEYDSGNIILNKTQLQTSKSSTKRYTYKGHQLVSYFQGYPGHDVTEEPNIDTSEAVSDSTNNDNEPTSYILADTLGYADGKANFIRFRMGNGHITLHASPYVLSNYFLLQSNNIDYLTAIWQSLSPDIDHIYWSSFLYRSAKETDSNVLWRYPSTRWALMLGILLICVYVLFQLKRRQRIIPIIPPLKNESVSFVETVGRLYYNKGNNTNLAEKMIQQFLEWVRTNYYLNTNMLNDEFIRQLSMKSGETPATVGGIVGMIHEVRLRSTPIDDAFLHQLYRTTQIFYKNNISYGNRSTK